MESPTFHLFRRRMFVEQRQQPVNFCRCSAMKSKSDSSLSMEMPSPLRTPVEGVF